MWLQFIAAQRQLDEFAQEFVTTLKTEILDVVSAGVEKVNGARDAKVTPPPRRISIDPPVSRAIHGSAESKSKINDCVHLARLQKLSVAAAWVNRVHRWRITTRGRTMTLACQSSGTTRRSWMGWRRCG